VAYFLTFDSQSVWSILHSAAVFHSRNNLITIYQVSRADYEILGGEGVCGMQRVVGDLKERDNLEDLGVDDRIILNGP